MKWGNGSKYNNDSREMPVDNNTNKNISNFVEISIINRLMMAIVFLFLPN